MARELAQTPAYIRSKRERNKIESLFSELKLRMGLQRVRLRRLWNVSEQFYLAATAQNLKRLVRFLAERESVPDPCSTKLQGQAQMDKAKTKNQKESSDKQHRSSHVPHFLNRIRWMLNTFHSRQTAPQRVR